MPGWKLIILVLCISSCSVLQTHDGDGMRSANTHPSSRRADRGKYIANPQGMLGARSSFQQPVAKQRLSSSKAVADYLARNLTPRNANCMMLILLNPHYEVLGMDEICPVNDFDPTISLPVIMSKISDSKASSVILVQYQPSRSAPPFARDHAISREMRTALESADVNLLDIVIVNRTQCFSFADHRWI